MVLGDGLPLLLWVMVLDSVIRFGVHMGAAEGFELKMGLIFPFGVVGTGPVVRNSVKGRAN